MTGETELTKKRFIELARRAGDGGYFTFTDFLGLAEQSLFAEVSRSLGTDFTVFGGCDGAERVMVRFGDRDMLEYAPPFPIATILIRPRAEKFASELTHRDFLGSLMNLGIERDCLGDIVIHGKSAHLFATEEIAPFIISSLERVRNTDVVAELSTLDEGIALFRTEARQIQISSERLDAVIAKAYHLSREDAQAYFRRGQVFVNGRLIENTSYTPHEGEKISVRTLGRLIYRGVTGTSRKGKLNVTVEMYI